MGYQRVEPGKTEAWLKTAGLGREIFGFNDKGPTLMYERNDLGDYIFRGADPLSYVPLFGLSHDRKELLKSFEQATKDRDYTKFLPLLFRL